MPRKKVTDTGTGNVTKTKIAFAAILAFFTVSSLEIADFALELVTDAVKQRHAKGKAVLAGRAANAGNATEAVNAATASAIGGGPSGVVPARKKPGPAPGSKKGQKAGDGQAGATTGAGEANTGSGVHTAGGEVTDAAALPPQEGVLDLDAMK